MTGSAKSKTLRGRSIGPDDEPNQNCSFSHGKRNALRGSHNSSAFAGSLFQEYSVEACVNSKHGTVYMHDGFRQLRNV